mgnify:CR=1 FL=1
MSFTLTAALILTMVATSLLSGVFGMAGGLVLIGVLLVVLPVADAMALHAVTQIASNGWRALLWWRHIRPMPVVAHVVGCLLALGAWRGVALLLLGVSPFLAQALPPRIRPNPERPLHGVIVGAISMSLMVLTGVSGPLLDRHFLGGALDRRQIVATKAACQAFGHGMKLAYFGAMVADPGQIEPWLAVMAVLASMTGTMLAKRLLEAMSDTTYRLWAGRIVTVLGLFYIGQGSWLLLAP